MLNLRDYDFAEVARQAAVQCREHKLEELRKPLADAHFCPTAKSRAVMEELKVDGETWVEGEEEEDGGEEFVGRVAREYLAYKDTLASVSSRSSFLADSTSTNISTTPITTTRQRRPTACREK